MSIINALILGSSTIASTPTRAKSTDEAKSSTKVIMDDSSSSSPSIMVVAASLGAVFFVALIIFIAVIVLRRKKRQGKGRESPSVVRIKPLLLFPTWKKFVMIWWFRISSFAEANNLFLPLSGNHWLCQNVIFQMIFTFDWIIGLLSRTLLQDQWDAYLHAWSGNWFLLPNIKIP